ncbi:CcdB family protein [Gracilinema caldarium]|uniref:CcdB family protein n=1 Tax=Gracilinema caldarium TaxID=215591 RepID=UPI0026F272DF|nr:CcdB family protein [Gracilinema caldarium]
MSQYHIYANLNETSKKIYPYLLDVQSSILSDLETRIVIPLASKEIFEKGIIKNLNPIIFINNKEFILLTQQMAGVPVSQLGSSIGECISYRQDILSAIDFLITGI